MKRLYVLRHAKSSWAEPGLSDFDRSLNKRGERQLTTLSQWFANQSEKPQHVICSSAVRTRLTYEGIKSAIEEPELEIVDQLYNGSMDSYLETLWGCDNAGTLMLIGHNPTCDELVRFLTSPSSPAAAKLMTHHFGTATIAVFDFDGGDWSQLGRANCSLVELLRPKELDAAATL